MVDKEYIQKKLNEAVTFYSDGMRCLVDVLANLSATDRPREDEVFFRMTAR